MDFLSANGVWFLLGLAVVWMLVSRGSRGCRTGAPRLEPLERYDGRSSRGSWRRYEARPSRPLAIRERPATGMKSCLRILDRLELSPESLTA